MKHDDGINAEVADEVWIAVEGRDIEVIRTLVEGLSALQTDTHISVDDGSSSAATGIPWTEIVLVGKNLALIAVPIVAYMIGKGKKVKVKTRERTIELTGFSKEEVKELYNLVSKGGGPKA